jgi:hypothetical protein
MQPESPIVFAYKKRLVIKVENPNQTSPPPHPLLPPSRVFARFFRRASWLTLEVLV